MRIKMELLEDTIFGNGVSVPGGEDISVLCDADGFPYFKGGTFKGIFREEMERCLFLMKKDAGECIEDVDCNTFLGEAGDDSINDRRKITFSDFTLSEAVRQQVIAEIGKNNPQTVLDACTHLRVFTAIDDNGQVKEGSLRSCRCVNRGLVFYSDLECLDEDGELVEEVLGFIKWVGSMRNRGFGKVRISVCEGGSR